MFKKGTTVRLKQPIIQGIVKSKLVASDGETLLFLVQWADENEVYMHERYFTEAELEQVA